jgi:hypothetical protein
VSLTKGEGYGRPFAEFALSKKPIVATNWSGHIDFLSPEFSILLPGEVKPCHPSAYAKGLIIEGASWFAPDHGAATKALSDIFENYSKYEVLGKRQGHKIKTEFNYDNMVLLLADYLKKHVPDLPKLVLPKLKKIELPKLKKELLGWRNDSSNTIPHWLVKGGFSIYDLLEHKYKEKTKQYNVLVKDIDIN